MQPSIRLIKSRRRRLEGGHPWIYQSEIQPLSDAIEPGDIVDIQNHQGVFLARGYVNPKSQIVARVLTYKQEPIDEAFFERRIQEAWQHRIRFVENPASCRVIYGEADFLPGLIVDKYADVLVVQLLSLGMDIRKEWILSALCNTFHPQGIYLRNDASVRTLEGLPIESGVWWGTVPEEIQIVENGLHFLIDVKDGQKTGYFFDQRENRAAIRPLMTGWQAMSSCEGQNRPNGASVLECFCHTGSFAVNAVQYGAEHVKAIDISEHAISVAAKNARINSFQDKIDFEVANAFDYLRQADKDGEKYDVVILDPPAFAKSRRALEGAIRGYKEINLRGMKLVSDGGYLVTASCSYHMLPDLFRETILEAAMDARKVLRLVHWTGAGKDHPEIAGVEEGHYLKFAIFQVFSRG